MVNRANFYTWAQDFGFKYRGLALNGQYFLRWLNDFRADGPLPISSTFDHGFEASVGNFFYSDCELYARTSFVFGQFRDSYEYRAGFNWYPLRTGDFEFVARSDGEQSGREHYHTLPGWTNRVVVRAASAAQFLIAPVTRLKVQPFRTLPKH